MDALNQSRLTLQFIVGTNEFGEDIVRNKSFNNVKATATDEQLQSIAQDLASIQQHGLKTAIRNNTIHLL
ncbi:DUF1659 domain-containing protein [Halalkalibacterium ligniniphilum]|uniref:DUF1659 domain-containing protein n=1 Tax=Halalkalibacterium ligniniphilum TaxID=1134413 RepID=UPI00034B9300|nr:DUF1659 domain-containing protein [Halalkalibacterium ligniniphilum]